ncbi:MAG: 5'/3'-nucleotidase SurE [Treponema sp.]|jgi:5'-nucleotidase|nr:5'/3'-nucleotidase SurE [Treponema sp.]
MNILLTNDDGIGSEGILLLARALRNTGDHRVFVIAPDRDRSGVSHCISFLREPLRLKEREPDTWTCSGNPADCVIAGMLGALPLKPELILSGINRGANLGTDLVYSGTAAAARQGGLFSVPSIALSLVESSGGGEYFWDMAVSFTVGKLKEFTALWEPDTFLNVNIPNSPGGPAGSGFAFPCRRQYEDGLSFMKAPNGELYGFARAGKPADQPEPGSDLDTVSRNLVSLSLVLIHPVVSRTLIDRTAGGGAAGQGADGNRADAGGGGGL